MTNYENFGCIASREQFAIKSKENINLSITDTVLKLLDTLYILGLKINVINIAKLWHNGIDVYISPS